MIITKRKFLKYLFLIPAWLFMPFKLPIIPAKKQMVYIKHGIGDYTVFWDTKWKPIGYAKINIIKGQDIAIQVKNGKMYAKEIEFLKWSDGNSDPIDDIEKSYYLKRDWD